MVSIFGLLFSLNLGRLFLSETKKNQSLQKNILPSFLNLNYVMIFCSIFFAFMFWCINPYSRLVLDFRALLAFLILTPYCLWTVNGAVFYSALNKNLTQDVIIFIQRVILVVAIFLIYILNIKSVNIFLYTFAIILSLGAFFEMSFLAAPKKSSLKLLDFKNLLKTKDFHMDYLSFHLYPLFLTVFAAFFIKLADLGKLNFLIQLINFITILSVVASLKVKSYVGSKGILKNVRKIKNILFFTIVLAAVLVVAIFFFLNTNFFSFHFPTFGNISTLFLMIAFSVPGFFAYQFLYPILIEFNLIGLASKIHLSIFAIMIFLAYPFIKLFGLQGAVFLYAFFYFFILLSQIYLFRVFSFKLAKN